MNRLAPAFDAAQNREIKEEAHNCERHGDYLARKHWFMTDWTGCSQCEQEEKAKNDAAAAEKAEQEKKQQWTKKLNEAAIPERFMNKKLGTYEAKNDGQKAALAFSVAYAKNFNEAFRSGQCVVFCGTPGTGKTHLAVGIALNVMHNQNRTAVFTTVQRVMRRVKGTWSRSSEETENEVMSIYQSADLLILDEVGVQYGSDSEKQILFDLFNERYERRLPTIFISNLQLKDQVIAGKTVLGLQSFLGDRVYDRIKEDGGKVVPFTWESHRGQ